MTDILQDQGMGYKTDKGTVCMIRCFSCGKENYALVVAHGYCAWCGFNPNEGEK